MGDPTCYRSRDGPKRGRANQKKSVTFGSRFSPPSSDAAAGTAQHSTTDTMRDVLLGLADDLSRGILLEWLEPADVARLDTAYNNRTLSRVLRGLLCSPLTLFGASYSRSYAKLKWAMKRRLNLGSLKCYESIPEDMWTSIALTTCLDRLTGCWTSRFLLIV